MFVEPGWEEMSGRWFTGGYEEIGMDVSLKKVGASPVVAGVAPRAVRVGTRGQDVTIFGANLPRTPAASTVDFGPGMTVERVVRATPDSITVRVNVDSDGGGRQARSVPRRRVAARRGSRVQSDQPDQGHAARRAWRASAAPCSRNSSSSSTRSRTTMARRQAGHRRRPRDRAHQRDVGSRGVRRHLRRRRREVRRLGRSDRDCSRRTSTGRIRRAARAATTSATSGSWRRISRPTRARVH